MPSRELGSQDSYANSHPVPRSAEKPTWRPYEIRVVFKDGESVILQHVEEYAFGLKYFYVVADKTVSLPRINLFSLEKRPMGTTYWTPISMSKRVAPKDLRRP